MPAEPGPTPTPGLVGAAKRLARTLLDIVRTRLEILATEVEEERLHIAQLLLLLSAVVFCFGVSVVLAVIFLVVLLWDSYRLTTLGALAGLFLVAGIVAVLVVRQQVRARPKMFASTLSEIATDIKHVQDQT